MSSGHLPIPFAYKLALNQWLLGLFNVKRFEELAEHLRNEALEGLPTNDERIEFLLPVIKNLGT